MISGVFFWIFLHSFLNLGYDSQNQKNEESKKMINKYFDIANHGSTI